MADGILGLGSGQAASLNNELIDKLKSAERESTVAPIETDIEDIATENEVFATIDEKIDELLETVKVFDLFVTGGATAFDQKSATTSGDSVVFNADDVSALNTGITTVNVTDLAQKDVYQSNTIDETIKDVAITGLGNLTINSTTFTTEGKTYEELADEINLTEGINASLEQVGNNSYRLVLKSDETGVDNALNISGDASTALGLDLEENNILKAQNMQATVDGVAYSISSNNLEVDGLTISATKTGESSINISKDTSTIETSMNDFVTKYNELIGLIEDELYSSDSVIEDKSALRDIISQVKDKLFGSYGDNSDKSIFNYGFELGSTGVLSLDSTVFNAALEEDPEGMKNIFIGTAENKGIGTQLKELIDNMGYTEGVIGLYESSLQTREDNLNDELELAEEALEDKYSQLATQFASYSAIITQYETSFSGLSLMIEQSTSA
ncbi:flagellar filament capping protein FliD [Poseidonibacter antarcticus]|uniref:flagellar filament capping protein FliD n=1 Tax=Poseidonibacter antarcticus TaxID=2478538 RepID=UPI000EF440DE|nr:flagellar filament capping protein FliD [Poseidonibacter antarcticus]